MKIKPGILIIFGLLSLIGAVTAHLPDASTISASNDWLIANGVDQVIITVTALNSSTGAINGATVQFTIDNPIYGSISPLTVDSHRKNLILKLEAKNTPSLIKIAITKNLIDFKENINL